MISDDNILEILLIEDNEGDAELAKEAFSNIGHKVNLSFVNEGEQVLRFLRKEGAYADAPRPHLILLDLNLPRKDGREVLAEIKNDKNLRRIPVIVLTSSKADKDVAEAYDLHANSYIAKSMDFSHYVQTAEAIDQFWFSAAILPKS